MLRLPDKQVQEYVEALQKGGVDKKVAQAVIKKWQEAGGGGGADADPAVLRKLFLKQSSVPLLATLIQVGSMRRSCGSARACGRVLTLPACARGRGALCRRRKQFPWKAACLNTSDRANADPRRRGRHLLNFHQRRLFRVSRPARRARARMQAGGGGTNMLSSASSSGVTANPR